MPGVKAATPRTVKDILQNNAWYIKAMCLLPFGQTLLGLAARAFWPEVQAAVDGCQVMVELPSNEQSSEEADERERTFAVAEKAFENVSNIRCFFFLFSFCSALGCSTSPKLNHE